MRNFIFCFSLFISTLIFSSCEDHSSKDSSSSSMENEQNTDLDDLSPDQMFELAKQSYQDGNLEEAIKALNKKLSFEKDDQTFSLKGDIHFSRAEFDAANESYRLCRIENPKNTYCLLNLAKIQQYLGNFKKSISLIDSALFLEKTLAEAYFLKGLSFELQGEKGDLDLAISSYQTTIELDNSYYDAFMRLGDIFAKQKNDLAIEYYRSAQTSKPERLDCYYNRAIYLQESERFTEAMETYDEMINADANSFLAYHNQGYILLVFSDEYEEAIEKFSKCLDINSNYIEAYHNRGLAYKNIGAYDKAKADFKEALLLNPDSDLTARELSELDKLN